MNHKHKWQYADYFTKQFSYDFDESITFVCECGKSKRVKETT